ncbi:MAG: threonine--tRNA ligase [Thermoproteota archaeon]|nr:threonine--tRNA ligase [Thermoproteota archaeon]
MRLLQLHTDFIEYEPIEKEIRDAEDIAHLSKIRVKDLVVVFVAVENRDDESIAKMAVDEIKKYLGLVKSTRLLIYPYAHLSSDLAPPTLAIDVIRSLEIFAKESINQVYRAPFGWTKSFNIKVKGHPMAENSKEISKHEEHKPADSLHGEKESYALKDEEKLTSSWYVMQPGGQMTPLDSYNFKKHDWNLKKLSTYEIAKNRAVNEQPAHVRLMKKLAIADYEPASDSGNIRYYPKGRLMKSLIEQYVTRRVMEYGGIEVETPIMYDTKHPSLQSYFNRFPARQYSINSDNKQLFLRFAACFGQFLMAKDFNISYKHLPLKLYELTRYSFRREKSGELVGLRRLRAFTMPDCHAFCRNVEQAKEEFLKRFELSISVLNDLGLTINDVEMAIRFTEEFYTENKDFMIELVNRFGKSVLVEKWKERFFYFTLKWEFNFIDGLGKASALSTDQIDVENGARYGIEFVEEDGTKKNPIILHNSPSGAIERVIYALLEKSAKISKEGGIASLPLWLSHTQVRVIPVSQEHIVYCEKILIELAENQIRADIDDRDETVGKKIRESETEWVRYTIVIGDKEINSDRLTVRDRNVGKQREITLGFLIDEVKEQTKDKPYLPLNLPVHLSSRPQIMV